MAAKAEKCANLKKVKCKYIRFNHNFKGKLPLPGYEPVHKERCHSGCLFVKLKETMVIA